MRLRVWHFDLFTAVLRETLPENRRGRWYDAVDKLKKRFAERPQFGENVNDFLTVLHKQMEACTKSCVTFITIILHLARQPRSRSRLLNVYTFTRG